MFRCLALCFLLAWGLAWGASPQSLDPAHPTDLLPVGTLAVAAPGDTPPASRDELPAFLAGLPPAGAVSIFGGAYWLHARVRHDSGVTQWMLDPNNTVIERVHARLFGSDGSVQMLDTGYVAPRTHALHYGTPVELKPGVDYDVLVRLDSPYYASVPRVELHTETAYRALATRENVLVLAGLGAMAALGVFNLFVFALTGTRSHLFFGAQMLVGVCGWGMTFHVPADLFDWHDLRWHYVPFFLAPVFGSLFCDAFLELRERAPGFHRAFRALAFAGALLTPVPFFALPYAHALATLLIAVWITLALVAGIRSWRGGFQPARFFVIAFAALALPASIILPGNLDLVPDLVRNAELVTMLGNMFEGLLQAFALADRIRLARREKDMFSARLVKALQVAHTDVLTGIGNRFAFDTAMAAQAERSRRGEATPQVLFVIDLDGLKTVNDRFGHHHGDELIRTFARGLRDLVAAPAMCFRQGGDEFAVLAPAADEVRLRAGLMRLEAMLLDGGFEHTGVSYGVAHWAGHDDPQDLLKAADRHMYAHKNGRKRGRDHLGVTVAAELDGA